MSFQCNQIIEVQKTLDKTETPIKIFLKNLLIKLLLLNFSLPNQENHDFWLAETFSKVSICKLVEKLCRFNDIFSQKPLCAFVLKMQNFGISYHYTSSGNSVVFKVMYRIIPRHGYFKSVTHVLSSVLVLSIFYSLS